jgi:hypothetical protein
MTIQMSVLASTTTITLAKIKYIGAGGYIRQRADDDVIIDKL